MRISTSWINDLICRTLNTEQIVQALEASGIEVEQIYSSKPLDRKVVVGQVNKVIQHPDAERLHVCEVNTGSETIQIVCGAPNVREGLIVAVATVGTTLPDGTVIKKAKLRGQASEGMLCSERELGLGSDHDGILELSFEYPVGSSMCDIVKNDVQMDIKTAPNRFDLQSMVGIAREVAAFSQTTLQPLVAIQHQTEQGPTITIEALPKQVPRYMLQEVELGTGDHTDIKTTKYLIDRLTAAGQRAISPVVDVTNFVMLEYGQPLHAYDADTVTLPIGVRQAKPGETLTTLDGVERTLTENDLVVVDARGPIGLAGIMGGLDTQVTSSTRRIYLESAVFDGAHIRRTALRLGLRSEASSRFERRLPLELPPLALARASMLLTVVAAARPGDLTDELRQWPWIQRVGIRQSRLTGVLGYTLSAPEAMTDLRRLEIDAQAFDVAARARELVGRPYKFGARYKTDAVAAFDCSYLTDYLYSLIGMPIGHTAHQQFEHGREVSPDALEPGDILFRGGPWVKLDEQARGGVSHCALYVGNGRIVEAADYRRDEQGEWAKLPQLEQQVVETDVKTMVTDPQFLGARRYADHLDDFLSIPSVPWWRTDIKSEADIVEEVARLEGYDRVPATIPVWRPRSMQFDHVRRPIKNLKDLLTASGLFEVTTYSFIGPDQLALAGQDATGRLRISNPLSSEQAYLRRDLFASQLQVLAKNRGYAPAVGFYEVSRVFIGREDNSQPEERLHASITILDPASALARLHGIIDLVTRRLNVPFSVRAIDAPPGYMPGRSGHLLMGRHIAGTMGQLSAAMARTLKVNGEIAYAEIDLAPLFEQAKPVHYEPLSRFPGTTRDITILLPDSVHWAHVTAALAGRTGVTLAYVSEYRGASIPPGKRNVTLSLQLRHADRTPTDAEADTLEAWAQKRLASLVAAAEKPS